jgi:hypothetical protein
MFSSSRYVAKHQEHTPRLNHGLHARSHSGKQQFELLVRNCSPMSCALIDRISGEDERQAKELARTEQDKPAAS